MQRRPSTADAPAIGNARATKAAGKTVVRRSPRAMQLFLILLAILLQVIIMNFGVALYDEGISLYGAARVLHGQVPYRDFWTMYPPGQFYLLAGAFRLFGVLGLWDRLIFLLANTISLVAITHLLDQLTCRPWLNRLGAFAILLYLSCEGSYGFPIYQALCLILVATVCMLKRWRNGRPLWVFLAGFALGFAALFRHDFALYALVGLGTASVVNESGSRPAGKIFRNRWADLVRLAGTALLTVCPVVLFLLLYVPAHDLYYGLLYVPGYVYPKVRSIPFPNLQQISEGFTHLRYVSQRGVGSTQDNVVWLPLIVVALALPWLVTKMRNRSSEHWRSTGYFALIFLTALLFLKGLVRVSPLHMLQAVVPAIMLLICILAEFKSLSPAMRLSSVLASLWLSLCLLATAHMDAAVFLANVKHLRGAQGESSFAEACHPGPGLERAKCLFIGSEEADAIRFVQSETAPGDHIFSGVERYDVLFDNDISFYFFSARDAGTRWYDLHPGVETTEAIQREMINEFEANRVTYVVEEHLGSPVERNASGKSSGVTLLNNYIRANYRLQRQFGYIDILQRATPAVR